MTQIRNRFSLSKTAGWIALGFLLLIIFTVLKFPERKIKLLIQNQIIEQAAAQGIQLSYSDSEIDLIPIPRYTLIDASIGSRTQNLDLHFDRLEIEPQILNIILQKPSAHIQFSEKTSKGAVAFAIASDTFEINANLEELRLKDVPLQNLAQGIQLDGTLSGKVDLKGNLRDYTSMTGQINLALKQIVLPSQSIMGFPVPEIHASEGKIALQVQNSKATISTFRLGKRAGGTNELYLEAVGEIKLARSLFASTAQLKTKFKPPEVLLEQMPYIRPMIEAAKTPDGSFGFEVTGPISFPRPTPNPNIRL